jgi:hypothetical protein
MKRLLCLAVLNAALCTSAWAQSDKASNASAAGAASILASPVLSLEGKPLEASAALGLGGTFLVIGVSEAAGEVVYLTLKGVEAVSTVVVKASTVAAKAASIAVGTSVRVVAESTGYALIASGQLLAFIPNAIGQALLYQSQVQ